MTISWLDLGLGMGLGTVLGILGHWQIGNRMRRWSERRALHNEYHSLAGHYRNHLVREDGTHEPTGETIELTWRGDVFEATSFQQTGFPGWHSYISMSLQYKRTGTGHYNYVDSIHGGIQQLIYLKQERAFNVMGTSRTPNRQTEFIHYWKLTE